MNFEVLATAGLVSGAVALVQLLWLAHARRSLAVQSARGTEQLAQCERALAASRAQEKGLHQRVMELERRLTEVEETLANGMPGDNGQYQQAITLLQQGADPAVVASASGLTQSETELMALIRARRG